MPEDKSPVPPPYEAVVRSESPRKHHARRVSGAITRTQQLRKVDPDAKLKRFSWEDEQ